MTDDCEYTDKPEAPYTPLCMSFCQEIAKMLRKFERNIDKGLKAGMAPYDFPKGSTTAELIAGGVLLLFVGMVADDDGGKDLLMAAASKLRSESDMPMAEEIRRASDALLDTLGVKRTSHLWN